MTPFLHDHRDFEGLLRIVAGRRGLDPALVEKDYWITHTLWALQSTGFELWLKGGTSLSKGFALIERFSEDLDLRVDPGTVKGAPAAADWKRDGRIRIARRSDYFSFLARTIAVPSARIEMETGVVDPRARTADYRVLYPGRFLGGLRPPFRPYVLLEVGRARVEPWVERPIGSFVHEHVGDQGIMQEFRENRPSRLRCVHPLVTLVEKIDAIARGFRREPFEPRRFVRHYEDAARIILAGDTLPPSGTDTADLVREMLSSRDIRDLPSPAAPALMIPHDDRSRALRDAHAAIGPMFWGARMTLDESAASIRDWLVRI